MPSTAHDFGVRKEFQVLLSERLRRMELQFKAVRDGHRTYNEPREMDGIVETMKELVADARALEAPADGGPHVNVGAVQAANLLYGVRDELAGVQLTLTAAQRALIDGHRSANVDPDGVVRGALEATIAKLQEVKHLVAQGSGAAS